VLVATEATPAALERAPGLLAALDGCACVDLAVVAPRPSRWAAWMPLSGADSVAARDAAARSADVSRTAAALSAHVPPSAASRWFALGSWRGVRRRAALGGYDALVVACPPTRWEDRWRLAIEATLDRYQSPCPAAIGRAAERSD